LQSVLTDVEELQARQAEQTSSEILVVGCWLAKERFDFIVA
jgi:hypothetical protein